MKCNRTGVEPKHGLWYLYNVNVPAVRTFAPAVAGMAIRCFRAHAACQQPSAGIGLQVALSFLLQLIPRHDRISALSVKYITLRFLQKCYNKMVNVPAVRRLAERPAALKCYYSSGLRDWMRIGPQVGLPFLFLYLSRILKEVE